MKRVRVFCGAVMATLTLCVTLASSASAAVRYTYTGGNFTTANSPYTTSMHLSGWFELNAPIPPNTPWPADFTAAVTGFSFFDGVNTLTNANSSLLSARFKTNGSGGFDTWEIYFSNPVPATLSTPINFIATTSDSDKADTATVCQQVLDGACSYVFPLDGASFFQPPNAPPGGWQMDTINAVPTMSTGGVIFTVVLAVAGSIFILRRQNLPTA